MLYGRLADPDCTLGTDLRSDPRMVAALAPLGLDGRLPQPQLTVDAPLEDRLAFVTETRGGHRGGPRRVCAGRAGRPGSHDHNGHHHRGRRRGHHFVHQSA